METVNVHLNSFRSVDAFEFVAAFQDGTAHPEKLHKNLQNAHDRIAKLPGPTSYLLAAIRGYEAASLINQGTGFMDIVTLDDRFDPRGHPYPTVTT